jgi:hypothetical protein
MLCTLIQVVKNWLQNGEKGNIVLPPIVGTSVAPNASLENVPIIAPHSSPSVSFMVHASPTADINALTVSVVGSINSFFLIHGFVVQISDIDDAQHPKHC